MALLSLAGRAFTNSEPTQALAQNAPACRGFSRRSAERSFLWEGTGLTNAGPGPSRRFHVTRGTDAGNLHPCDASASIVSREGTMRIGVLALLLVSGAAGQNGTPPAPADGS